MTSVKGTPSEPLLEEEADAVSSFGCVSAICCSDIGYRERLEKKTWAIWVLRILNAVILQWGVLILGVCIYFTQHEALGGDWVTPAMWIGVTVVITGVVGILSTIESMALLSMLYFTALFSVTIVGFWGATYAFFDQEQFESKIKLNLQGQWDKYYPTLPDAVQDKFTAHHLTCTTMTDECWGQIKDYIDADAKVFGGIVLGLFATQLVLLFTSWRVNGTAAIVNTLGTLLDLVTLLVGVVVSAVAIYLLTSTTAGQLIPIVVLGCGVILVALSTLFGTQCKWCKGCNSHHMIAAICYTLLSILVLAISIYLRMTDTSTQSWVEKNFASVCDTKCATDFAGTFKLAANNSTACAGTVKPVSCAQPMTPRACYDLAIANCDTKTATHAHVTMVITSEMEQIGWFLQLVFYFLLAQTITKFHKGCCDKVRGEGVTSYEGVPGYGTGDVEGGSKL